MNSHLNNKIRLQKYLSLCGIASRRKSEKIILDVKKETIRILTASKSKCAVCGKNIEIFDEVTGCPICSAKAHKEHLTDWVRMKHSCPICKKSLNVSSTGQIFID